MRLLVFSITDNYRRNLNNLDSRHVTVPGLNRERLVEELLVEILLDVVDEDDRFALVIKLRPACSPHHLQNIYTHGTYITRDCFSISCYTIF